MKTQLQTGTSNYGMIWDTCYCLAHGGYTCCEVRDSTDFTKAADAASAAVALIIKTRQCCSATCSPDLVQSVVQACSGNGPFPHLLPEAILQLQLSVKIQQSSVRIVDAVQRR